MAILARQENHLFTDYQIATLRIFLAKLFATDETRQVQLKPFYGFSYKITLHWERQFFLYFFLFRYC